MNAINSKIVRLYATSRNRCVFHESVPNITQAVKHFMTSKQRLAWFLQEAAHCTPQEKQHLYTRLLQLKPHYGHLAPYKMIRFPKNKASLTAHQLHLLAIGKEAIRLAKMSKKATKVHQCMAILRTLEQMA